MTLLVGRQEGLCVWVGQSADLHMVQLTPLPLTNCCSRKSRLVLPSWFYDSGAGPSASAELVVNSGLHLPTVTVGHASTVAERL